MSLRRLQATAILLIPCHIKFKSISFANTAKGYLFLAMSPMVNQIFLVIIS